jgi:choice-of-anchor B domain-containing protein
MKINITLLVLWLSFTQVWSQTLSSYNLNQLSQRTYTQELSSIWGWTSPQGVEYAIVGTTTGTSIVSLANPAAPVQVQFIPGQNTIWREMKTYGNYCYLGCDNCSEGLLIMDMSTLTSTFNYFYYKPRLTVNGDTDTLRSIHTLYVEGSYLYLGGTNLNVGEVIIMSLANPLAPNLVGFLPPPYAHDMFVRGDTIYSSHIYDGYFSMFNIANKSNPVLIATQNTPSNFTHNSWLTDNSRALFTTDERANAFVASYDVSNPSNIVELDRWETFETSGTGVIPHNVHVLNDFIVLAHYTNGVTILDGRRPDNLVEVGRFDTYPVNQTGFFGVWGVYPYFNSGIIIASDINTGLHVLQPTYSRACWLEGNITDTLTNAALSGVRVTINTTPVFEDSRLNGDYKTGYGIAGTYTVTYSKAGYYPKTLTVNLQSNIVNIQNVQLMPMIAFGFSGQVLDNQTGLPVANAKILMRSDLYTHTSTTNAAGNFSIPSVFMDTFEVFAGKWGYKTILQNSVISSSTPSPVYRLDKGYRDEFILDLGWTESGNASSGSWERAVSEYLTNNNQAVTPDTDLSFDLGNQCYVTGANNNGSISADDIDGGNTILRSPNFDLSNYTTPYLSYYAWFVDILGQGNPNDSMIVRIHNGNTTAVLAVYRTSTFAWTPIQNFRVANYITPNATMYLTVEAFDRSPGHVVEAAFDLFEIVDSAAAPTAVSSFENEKDLVIYPNPSKDIITIDFPQDFEWIENQNLEFYDALGRWITAYPVSAEKRQTFVLGSNFSNGLYFVRYGNQTIPLQVYKQ